MRQTSRPCRISPTLTPALPLEGEGEEGGTSALPGYWLLATGSFSNPIICHEPFQIAYPDRFIFLCKDAHFFALVFLRTDSPANCRQKIFLSYPGKGLLKFAFRNMLDKCWYLYFDRATAYTSCFFTIQTPLRLRDSFFLGQP